jgi:hypothetical protein
MIPRATFHVMTGCPGSGKTTMAWNLVRMLARQARWDGQSKGCSYFGLDAIRGFPKTMVWPRLEPLPDWERICVSMQESYFEMILLMGGVAVIDNTHLWPDQLVSMIDCIAVVISEYSDVPMPKFVVHDLTDVSLEDCINRNARRADWVHPEVILELFHKHLEARATGWRLTAEWLEKECE